MNETLKRQYEDTLRENERLVAALEEAKKHVSTIAAMNNIDAALDPVYRAKLEALNQQSPPKE